MKKHTPRAYTKISVSLLAVLICLQTLLLGCGILFNRSSVTDAPEELLWTLTNPKQSFNVVLNPGRLDYQIDEYLTLHLRVTEAAHLIVFNWDRTGTLAVLFPNAYQPNNRVDAGATYTLPGEDADFDIRLAGPVGTEQFKVIALRNADDSTAIINFFPQENGTFHKVTGDQRLEAEKQIHSHLRQIDSKDWAEDTQTVEMHAATPPPEPPPVAVAPIRRDMFFQPQPIREDVIIDAGALGRYRFSEDTKPTTVPPHLIRQELVDLLNNLQGVFGHPMLITSGYHSRQHDIYLWAKWLSEHPQHIEALNRQAHPNWEAWVNASQVLSGCPPLQSKHQNGEAVNFYWEALIFDSVNQLEHLTQKIRETGGTRDYTLAERQRFNISDNDNYLFAVTAHPPSEVGDIGIPVRRSYFHVEYQPSAAPALPNIADIGMRLSTPEPEPEKGLWALTNADSSFSVSLKPGSKRYQMGSFLTLEAQATDHAYLIIFNWDETGRLAILLPNTFQPDNFTRADTAYFVPGADADFNIRLPGPTGLERFKVIALRYNHNNRDIIDLFRTGDDPATQQFWVWERSTAEIVENRVINYLREMDRADWAEDTDTAEIYEAERQDEPGPPSVIVPDYDLGDIVYIRDEDEMYFGEVTAEVLENAETVAVDIFNPDLRKKLGDTVPIERVIGKRIAPPQGWGIQEIMLSFYRGGEWTFTTDVVVFEEYYLLPVRVDGNPVRGSRKVTLAEVRIPVTVPF